MMSSAPDNGTPTALRVGRRSDETKKGRHSGAADGRSGGQAGKRWWLADMREVSKMIEKSAEESILPAGCCCCMSHEAKSVWCDVEYMCAFTRAVTHAQGVGLYPLSSGDFCCAVTRPCGLRQSLRCFAPPPPCVCVCFSGLHFKILFFFVDSSFLPCFSSLSLYILPPCRGSCRCLRSTAARPCARDEC